METLKFYKDTNQSWYIDLPIWKGSQSDLEMVEGADDLLDHLSNGKNKIELKVSETDSSFSNYLRLIDINEINKGANYFIKTYNEHLLELNVWLCEVTKFVFGYFPKIIYFQVVK